MNHHRVVFSTKRAARAAFGFALASFCLLGVSIRTASAQWTQEVTDPGAVATNGNFFVLKQDGSSVKVCEWKQGNWVCPSTLTNTTLMSPPSPRTQTGGFFFTVDGGGASYGVRGWEPPATTQYFNTISLTPTSAPSEVMYQNRVFIVRGDGILFEQFVKWSVSQYSHGSPDQSGVTIATPTVLKDGSVFVTTRKGELYQRWWNPANSQWSWHNHHYCQDAILPANRVKAVWTGAPMLSSKMFVTCDDGTLREVYYNGSTWLWANHGNAGGYYLNSHPVAIADGKLFVTGLAPNGTRALLQLYWNGSMWLWANHGTPPGTGISGAAAVAFGGDRAVVRGTDGNYYACFWNFNTSKWEWKNCGHP